MLFAIIFTRESMKQFGCITLLIFLSFPGYCQQLRVSWTKYIGGDSVDQANYATSTSDGGIVFTGWTRSGMYGTLSGDIPGNWADTAYNGLSQQNLVVGKLDSNRQLSWVKIYGGKSPDYGHRVLQTRDGGYAVLGSSESNDMDVSGNHGGEDLWLLKLNANGTKQWQRCFGGPGFDDPLSIVQTIDGGYLLLGYINYSGGDVPFTYVNSPFTSDWLLVKTDSLGNKQWSKTIGGTGYEGPGKLLCVDSNFYLAGAGISRDHECATDTNWHAGTAVDAASFIMKFDWQGNRLWAKSYGGKCAAAIEDAIWDERDSSIVAVSEVTGWPHDHMVPVNPAGGNNANNDLWILKTDKDGLLKWSTVLGDSSNEAFKTSIIKGSDGRYLVSCRTKWLTQPVAPGHIGNSDDMELFLLDSSGHQLASKIMGGNSYEYPACVVGYKHAYAAIGETESSSFTEGNMENTYRGMGDMFISGIVFWPLSLPEINNNTGNGLTVSPNPAHTSVHVALPTNAKKGVLIISSNNGSEIYRTILKQGTDKTDIDTHNWAPGIYLVQWQSAARTLYAKLIIQ